MRTHIAVVSVFLGISLLGQEGYSSFEAFLERKPGVLESFEVTRHMHAKIAILGEAHLETYVRLEEKNHLTFEVMSESGSSKVRGKLRDLLKEEVQKFEKGGWNKSDFTDENYLFLPEDTGVKLQPKRKSDLLLQGHLLLGPLGEITRSEGKLVKDPTAWISGVKVGITYAELNGVRMPTRASSSGKLKLLGIPIGFVRGDLSVLYFYHSVNGVPVAE